MEKSKEMTDNHKAFIDSSYYQSLKNEIAHGYRKINHVLDNYGVDMSKELEEALQQLSKATEEVIKELE